MPIDEKGNKYEEFTSLKIKVKLYRVQPGEGDLLNWERYTGDIPWIWFRFKDKNINLKSDITNSQGTPYEFVKIETAPDGVSKDIQYLVLKKL